MQFYSDSTTKPGPEWRMGNPSRPAFGGTPKLTITGLSKRYGHVTALRDVSLDLYEGEFLTLLGPSGSGKTTLLMIVAGLVSPNDGQVWIGSKESTYLPPHQRDIGFVFQNYALFPHLTIYENIAFPLRMRKLAEKEIEELVHAALRSVRLPDVASRFPQELSGGQQQRIALARSTVYRPSIILMDEPLGALDRKLREEMQLEISSLHRELGITVLNVTHDQDEAMAMSDRICVMNHGIIEQIGSPEALYREPVSAFVGDFLGQANLLDGIIADADGHVSIVGGDGGNLRGRPSKRHRAGEAVKLLLRPESLRFVPPDDPIDNSLLGFVEKSIFSGGFRKFSVKLENGKWLSVTQLTFTEGSPPQEGDRVRVTWAPRDAVILGGSES